MINSFLAKLSVPYRDDMQFKLLFFTLLLTTTIFFIFLVDAFEAPRMVILMFFTGVNLLFIAGQHKFSLQLSKTVAMALLLLSGWFVVSFIFSIDFSSSIFGYYARRSNSMAFMGTLIIFILLLSNHLDIAKSIILSKLLVACAVAVGIIGVLQTFGIGYYAGVMSTIRPDVPGPGGNHNFSAMFLVGVIPLLVPLFSASKTNMQRIFYMTISFILLWSVVVFASRGAILGLLVAVIFGLVLSLIRKSGWKINLIISILLFLLTVISLTSYQISRPSSVDTSLNFRTDINIISRLQVWAHSVEIIKQHPITGVGFGNFLIGYQQLNDKSSIMPYQFDDPHNIFLLLAVTTGIPGVGIFLTILYFTLRAYLIDFWKTRSMLSWGLLVGLIALLVSMSFNPVTVANWVLLGFFISCSHLKTEPILLLGHAKIRKILFIFLGSTLIIIGCAFLISEFLTSKLESSYQDRKYQNAAVYRDYSMVLNPFNIYTESYGIATDIKLSKDPGTVRTDIEKFASKATRTSLRNQFAGTLFAMLFENTKDKKDALRALSYFQKADELDADHPALLTSYAYVAYKDGDLKLAERLASQAFVLSSQDPNFLNYILLAEIYLEQGRIKEMANTLRRANSVQPTELIKAVIDKYDSGSFTERRLPVYFPPIDII
mgnify:CR=1 FL=1